MSAPAARPGAVEALTATLRAEILDGRRPAGSRLVEQDLCARFGAARHSLRAALRALATEGLVVVERNRGARVARLGPQEIRWLYELRAALECEAARLALERHGGRLPGAVHDARDALVAACRAPVPRWRAINVAHAALHRAIVTSAGSPRIAAAHATLDGELLLFLLQLEPLWSPERMAGDHEALVAGLEADGPAVLRAHLRDAGEALAAAER